MFFILIFLLAIITSVVLWACADHKAEVTIVSEYKKVKLPLSDGKDLIFKGKLLYSVDKSQQYGPKSCIKVYLLEDGGYQIYIREIYSIESYRVESKQDVLNSFTQYFSVYEDLETILFPERN